MTNPDEDLLTTTEGVDEGSADSAVEGPDSGGSPRAGAKPVVEGAVPAPPVDMETDESRAVREQRDPGQQLDVGEG